MQREATTTPVRREDYAPPPFFIRAVELTFDLDAAKTIVTSRLHIERNAAVPRAPLVLHGEELTLLRVLADGQSVSFRHDNGNAAGNLVIDNPPEAERFTLELPPSRLAIEPGDTPAILDEPAPESATPRLDALLNKDN